MKKQNGRYGKKQIAAIAVSGMMLALLAGCGVSASAAGNNASTAVSRTAEENSSAAGSETAKDSTEKSSTGSASGISSGLGTIVSGSAEVSVNGETVTTTANVTSGGAIDATDLFSNRDLTQTADLSEAVTCVLTDGEDITITEEGVYLIQGSAANATIIVETAEEDEAKVQLVLDGVTITNENAPCIYVKSADKVFVTTVADTVNELSVTGSFTADGETNTDAVIFSKDDLVVNGLGTLRISSTDNGISCKDDLKVTGGVLEISCSADGLEANDSLRIAGGEIRIAAGKDGVHVENDEDETVGYFYLCGGTLEISAADDGVHATTILQIDGGTVKVSAGEGLEATWIQINGGTIDISASDDGMNAAWKSSICTPVIEINDGVITVAMGAGDTDAVDSNGYIYVNGGTLDITAQSPFDYDMGSQYNGGTIIVNGTETNAITAQMMGGGMMGGQMGGGHRR